MLRVLPFSVFLALIATNSFAEGLLITRSYAYSDEDLALKDAACISAFEENIAPQFRGLRNVTVRSSNIFDTSSGVTALYPDVDFGGDHGDAKGSISCMFSPENSTVTDVAVSFQGAGLGGFEKRGLSSRSTDPADWKVTSYSSQLSQ